LSVEGATVAQDAPPLALPRPGVSADSLTGRRASLAPSHRTHSPRSVGACPLAAWPYKRDKAGHILVTVTVRWVPSPTGAAGDATEPATGAVMALYRASAPGSICCPRRLPGPARQLRPSGPWRDDGPEEAQPSTMQPPSRQWHPMIKALTLWSSTCLLRSRSASSRQHVQKKTQTCPAHTRFVPGASRRPKPHCLRQDCQAATTTRRLPGTTCPSTTRCGP
jgi:hypothetical protein